MKRVLFILFLLGFVGQLYGQENKAKKSRVFSDLEIKGRIDVKDSVLNSYYKSEIIGFYNNGVQPHHTNTYVVEYDFREGVYTRNRLRAKVNRPMVFKITNINRLAYDIRVSAKD